MYSLNLINDICAHDTPDFIHNYRIVHDKDSNKVIEGLHFTFIELPKFTPHSIADKRMMVLWLRFLTEINSNTKDIPSDLLIIMLGTNDVKERFGANAACIGAGMERLLLKVKSVDCWGGKAPNILVVAPPCIKDGFHDAVMGAGCVEKSRGVAEQLRIVAERQGVHFMDAAECEFNEVDFMHLTCKGHARLAELLTAEVPKLV